MADTSPGILAIFNNVAIGREAEFEEWFQHEHLAEPDGLPSFLLGRRYEAVSGGIWLISTCFESVDIFKSAAYLERLDHPNCVRIVIEIFKDMNRTVCDRTFRRDCVGSTAVAVQFDRCPNESVEGYDRDFGGRRGHSRR